jgi:hypothetical protein
VSPRIEHTTRQVFGSMTGKDGVTILATRGPRGYDSTRSQACRDQDERRSAVGRSSGPPPAFPKTNT